MEPFFLRIFRHELERQCKFGMMAAAQLQHALDAMEPDGLWYSAQGLLIAAGNVSKLLWPPSRTFAARGAELRESLGVDDSSPLEPRCFRNHFEHFDERLENWMKVSKNHIFIDSNVGTIGGADEADCLRNFDPDQFAITFRGDTYPLRPIIDALTDLWNKAREKN